MVPKRLPCHKERFGLLDVLEYRRRSSTLPYGLRMEAEVTRKNDVSPCRMEAITLAAELDLIWAYIGGVPLFPKVLKMTHILSPVGWSSNSTEVEAALPATGGFAEIKFTQRGSYSAILSFMPLARALRAVRAYRASDDATKILIKLHYAAMRNPGAESSLMLLAKNLELARAILPGREDTRKQRALQSETNRRLRRSLHWLFGIANQRLEVRHIVRKPSKPELHARLTKEERADFLNDSELVLRDVISQRLNIELETVDSDS